MSELSPEKVNRFTSNSTELSLSVTGELIDSTYPLAGSYTERQTTLLWGDLTEREADDRTHR